MLKWIFITAAVIIISLLVYKFLLYSPSYKVETEDLLPEEDSGSVTYIVTSDISGGISIREIDGFTSEKNFPFTRYNLKPEINRKVSQERI